VENKFEGTKSSNILISNIVETMPASLLASWVMSGKNTKPILYIAQISSGVHVSGRKPWSKLQKQYHQFSAIVNHAGRDVPEGTSVQDW